MLALDTHGDYEIILPPQVAAETNYMPAFGLAVHRLLDGRHIVTRRARLLVQVPWSVGPFAVSLRIFQAFNVVGHPPSIDGFIGREFLKSRRLVIDYTRGSLSIA